MGQSLAKILPRNGEVAAKPTEGPGRFDLAAVYLESARPLRPAGTSPFRGGYILRLTCNSV